MPVMHRASRQLQALQALHYLGPLSTIVYFFTSSVIAKCRLHKARKRLDDSRRRYLALALLSAVVVSVLAQATSHLLEVAKQPQHNARQDEMVYLIGALMVYGLLTLNLQESTTPIWHPYLGAWSIAFVTEAAITPLGALVDGQLTPLSRFRLATQIFRTALVLCLCLSGAAFTLAGRVSRSAHSQHETEPLLDSDADHLEDNANGRVKPTTNGYGTTPTSRSKDDESDNDSDEDIDSDSEEPEQDRALKKEQRKRLEESGNWLTYLKEFRVFIPIIWPSKNRSVQACLAVVGLVIVADRFLNVLVPRQLGLITDQLTHGNGKIPWHSLALWMIYQWLSSQAGLSLVKSLAELPLQQFAFKALSSAAFEHIMHLDMVFHNAKNSGELIRAIEQGQNLQGLLEFACFEVGPMFIDLIIAFVYVYLLFDVYMALILLTVGVLYVYIGTKTTVWSIKQRKVFNTASRNESSIQNEAINNWQTVSHFNRGVYECDRYNSSLDKFNAAEWVYYLIYYIGGSAQSAVMLIGRLAATTLAVYRVSQGVVPVGHFVTLISYWRTLESPLASLSFSIRRVSQMLTDSERLLQLMLTKAGVESDTDAPAIEITSGLVEFDHVEFAYDARRTILSDVSFVAKPGQTIALVGETGGGKSTIMKLLYRYYDVGKGDIRIDGQSIRRVTLNSLRDSFGMVPQDPSLFNINVMENVRYARLDASDEEVMEACKAAVIHDKIMTFPEQYKSKVGERGVKLSGGELQRVAIARAILRQPKIVLLDEATSMIDAETESLIQQSFARLTAGRTTFIIAHRLSTIQHADQILVINDGQIVEHGTHEELFRLKGKYVALWSRQLSREVQDIGQSLPVDDKAGEALIDVENVNEPVANEEQDETKKDR